jgi:O-antigen/teichoic acid export membrane protein
MVKSIVNTLSTKFLSAVFSFLILLITSNYLGSEGRGQISLLIASITIVLLIANFVGGNTLIYLTPRKPIGELLLVSYLWSLLTILATFITLNALHAFEFQTCLHISVLSLLFSLSSVHVSILYGKENIETANKINLFQVVAHFFILSACFLVFDFKNIDTFIYSLYFTYLMAFILSAYSIKKYIHSPFSFKLKGTMRMAFSLGAIAQLANIFQFLNYRLDVYLLNKYDSIANLGIYSTTVAIAESVLLLGGSFALVQFSKISNTEDAGQSIAITTKLTSLAPY